MRASRSLLQESIGRRYVRDRIRPRRTGRLKEMSLQAVMRCRCDQLTEHFSTKKYWLNGFGISADRRIPPFRVRLIFAGYLQDDRLGFTSERAAAENRLQLKHGGTSWGKYPFSRPS